MIEFKKKNKTKKPSAYCHLPIAEVGTTGPLVGRLIGRLVSWSIGRSISSRWMVGEIVMQHAR